MEMVMTSIAYIVLCICILPKLVPKNHWLRFYVCYLAFFTSCLASSVIIVPMVIILPRMQYKSIAAAIASVISKIVGIEWEIRIPDMKTKEKGIFVGNHQSMFDILGLVSVGPKFGDVNIVSKREILFFWPLGLICYLVGCIFVDRGKKTTIQHLRLAAEKHFRRDSAQLLMFPEGTRNRGKGLLPFKKGAFWTAIEHQVPIYPFVLSPYYFIQWKKLFAGGKIVISFLEPIPTTNLKPENIDTLIQKTRTLIENEYDNLRKEMYKSLKCSNISQ